jgi:trehalose-6-phosphate synthase
MHEALTMPAAEPARRLSGAAETVRSNGVERWLGAQLDDLTRVAH